GLPELEQIIAIGDVMGLVHTAVNELNGMGTQALINLAKDRKAGATLYCSSGGQFEGMRFQLWGDLHYCSRERAVIGRAGVVSICVPVNANVDHVFLTYFKSVINK
ncbi:MAG: hypothetical protein GWN00_32285, partial [Aliifodinibius sp.]|nr:hypothetical protein [Phycisphaerae bacterium]NIS50374.1 hypothetical protein [Phycisphaerae bacterium]NIT60716.1 hypothetical protein [Fodinibius sp.]NIW97601.1 hypothetical protein [Phycisphaerae bacterium]NIY29298.1 hypothetical protein [Fodinibius sp.]